MNLQRKGLSSLKFFSALGNRISAITEYLSGNKKRAVLTGSAIYTVLFLIYASVCIFPAIKDTGAFLGADGIAQYYPFFLDFRSNTIDFIESLKSGNPQITMMNFEYFFGTDTIASTTMMFVPFLPYYFLSAFVPESAVPLFFAGGTVILSYLAGLSFLYLCSYYRKNMLWAGLFGAFYIFCGNYFFTAGLNHHFLYMFIGYPLMIVGMDRILTGKGWLLFVLSTSWVSIGGLPFVIYTIPFVVVFAAIRVYFLYKGHYFRNLGKYFLRGTLFTILALALSATPFLIFVSDYLSGMRTSGGLSLDILSLITPSLDHLDHTLNGTVAKSTTGVCAAVIPCFLYMFTSARAEKEAKVHSLVMLVLVSLPLIRFGLNVFQYELCRWGFVPAALMCFLAVSYMPRLMRIKRTERAMFLFVIITYGAGYLAGAEDFSVIFIFVMALINAVPRLRKLLIKLVVRAWTAIKKAFIKKSIILLIAGSLALLAVIIGIVMIIAFKDYRIIPETLIAVIATVIFVCTASGKGKRAVSSLMLAAAYAVSGIIYVDGGNFFPYVIEETPLITAAAGLEREENTFGRTASFNTDCSIIVLDRSGGLFDTEEMEKAENDSDQPVFGADPYINNALRFGIAEPAVFMSNINGDFLEFMRRCGQDSTSFFSKVDTGGFSGKEVIYSLFGVDKFYSYITLDCFYGIRPSEGFEVYEGQNAYFYYNDYALPAGVTYDTFMDKNEFDALNSAELPFAMMDKVYLEGYEYNGSTTQDYSVMCDFDLRQELRGETIFGIECYDNYITPKTDLSGHFVYLTFEGVECVTYEGGGTEIFTVKTGDRNYNYLIHNSNSSWEWKYYSDHYTLSLGFREENIDEIFFSSPFEFESVKLYAVPEEIYTSAYENRTAEILENVEMTTNTLTGDITVSSDKILSVNMLYNKGWTAYVDGVETPVYKANGLFLGIPLSEGSHTVKLVFCSPWLFTGLAISAAAVVLIIVMKIIEKKKAHKK